MVSSAVQSRPRKPRVSASRDRGPRHALLAAIRRVVLQGGDGPANDERTQDHGAQASGYQAKDQPPHHAERSLAVVAFDGWIQLLGSASLWHGKGPGIAELDHILLICFGEESQEGVPIEFFEDPQLRAGLHARVIRQQVNGLLHILESGIAIRCGAGLVEEHFQSDAIASIFGRAPLAGLRVAKC